MYFHIVTVFKTHIFANNLVNEEDWHFKKISKIYIKFDDFPHTTLTLEADKLLISLIYPIIHDSGWLTCVALLCNPLPMVNMGGKSQTEPFTPPIGFQWTPLHLVCGLWSMATQYNSVNKEDMWKDIVNWLNFKGRLMNYTFTPLIGLCIHMISTL